MYTDCIPGFSKAPGWNLKINFLTINSFINLLSWSMAVLLGQPFELICSVDAA